MCVDDEAGRKDSLLIDRRPEESMHHVQVDLIKVLIHTLQHLLQRRVVQRPQGHSMPFHFATILDDILFHLRGASFL